jgi:hypothetical protein
MRTATRSAVLTALAALAIASLAPALADTTPPSTDLAAAKQAAAANGLAYLAGVAAGGGATSDGIVEAVEGLGLDPGLWPTPQDNVLDRLFIPAVGTTGNDPIREIEAYAQSGYPLAVGGRDLVAELRAAWDSSPQGVGQAAFTVLGLHAAGLPDTDPTLQDAVAALRGGQAAGGFWVCDAAVPPQDVDCTGFALTALAAAHALTPELGSLSKAFLDHSRNADGSYEEHPDPRAPGPGNSDSTVWAINGYRALGEPEPEACWRFILSRQQADGSFAWERPGEDDGKHIKRNFATKDVLANLWTSFAQWPVQAPMPVAAGPVHADVPAPVEAPSSFAGVQWSAFRPAGPGAVSATGTSATLVLPEPGAWTLHADARGPGVHSRAKVPLQARNDPPALHPLGPVELDVGETLDWAPQAMDPEGQPLALSWALAGQSGTGPLRVGPTPSGTWIATLTATDPHGASSTLSVPVRVRGSAPSVEALWPAAGPAPGVAVEQPPERDLAVPPPVPPIGLRASWTSHDGVVDVEAGADRDAYLMLSWCDAAGCHEEAVVEGHAFLPAGMELRDVQVTARLGPQVETSALGDLLAPVDSGPASPAPAEPSPRHVERNPAAALGALSVLSLALAAALMAVAASIRRR